MNPRLTRLLQVFAAGDRTSAPQHKSAAKLRNLAQIVSQSVDAGYHPDYAR